MTTNTMQVVRDQILARRMPRGDERAIRTFCEEYLPKLYRYALQRMRNEADVDDVVQVVLANAARDDVFRGVCGEAVLIDYQTGTTR